MLGRTSWKGAYPRQNGRKGNHGVDVAARRGTSGIYEDGEEDGVEYADVAAYPGRVIAGERRDGEEGYIYQARGGNGFDDLESRSCLSNGVFGLLLGERRGDLSVRRPSRWPGSASRLGSSPGLCTTVSCGGRLGARAAQRSRQRRRWSCLC